MHRKVTISIDEHLLEKARQILRANGKTVDQAFREYLQRIAEDAGLQQGIAEFRKRSGKGNSHGWKWNREDANERR